MTNLTRWEPARGMMTLREAMDRLFDDAFTHPLDVARISDMPAIDMYQQDDEMVIKASMPGYEADDVNLSIEGDTVMISGEMRQEKEEKEATYYMREQRYGSFERSVRLPTMVKPQEAKAEFENGILTITLPVAEEERSKRINIKVK